MKQRRRRHEDITQHTIGHGSQLRRVRLTRGGAYVGSRKFVVEVPPMEREVLAGFQGRQPRRDGRARNRRIPGEARRLRESGEEVVQRHDHPCSCFAAETGDVGSQPLPVMHMHHVGLLRGEEARQRGRNAGVVALDPTLKVEVVPVQPHDAQAVRLRDIDPLGRPHLQRTCEHSDIVPLPLHRKREGLHRALCATGHLRWETV